MVPVIFLRIQPLISQLLIHAIISQTWQIFFMYAPICYWVVFLVIFMGNHYRCKILVLEYLVKFATHYNDAIMGAIASQITSLTIVYSIVFFRRRSKKTSKLRVTGLCEGNSPGTGEFPHKWPVTQKMFPFDDVIMTFRDRYDGVMA